MQIYGEVVRTLPTQAQGQYILVLDGRADVREVQKRLPTTMIAICASADRENVISLLKENGVVAIVAEYVDRKFLRASTVAGFPILIAETKAIQHGAARIDLDHNSIIFPNRQIQISNRPTQSAAALMLYADRAYNINSVYRDNFENELALVM